MILNGFEFGNERGARRPQRQQMRGYGQPAPMPARASLADPRAVAGLAQENAQLRQRLAALGAIVTQLQQRLAQASQRIVPAAQRVVEVPRAMNGDDNSVQVTMSQSAADRAWYGSGDFDGLDADLGLEG